jgi:hypothetical protein
LVRELVSRDLRGREQAADAVADWLYSYSEAEVAVVVGVLLALVMSEPVGSCREAQLHALAELVDTGKVHREALASVDWGAISGAAGSEIEYVEFLKSTMG